MKYRILLQKSDEGYSVNRGLLKKYRACLVTADLHCDAVLFACGFLLVAVVSFAEESLQNSHTTLSCASYIFASEAEQTSYAYGYLEGVQAALKWEGADVLIPPTNRDHPMWWVLPPKFDSPRSLAEQFLVACKTRKHRDLLDTIFSIAAKKRR